MSTREGIDGLVWHYTSGESLASIVRNHEIHATSAAFMNDASELRAGLGAFRELFEREAKGLDAQLVERIRRSGVLSQTSVQETFLLSASLRSDSLTMWRYYGTSQVAYAIGLDPGIELVPRAIRPGDEHPAPPPGYYDRQIIDEEPDGTPIFDSDDPDHLFIDSTDWRRVEYVNGPDHDAITSEYRRIVDDFANNRASFFIYFPFAGGVFGHMKDSGFEDEREVRVMYSVHPDWKFVDFRAGRLGSCPSYV